MDAHSDTATVEAPAAETPIEALPDEQPVMADISFLDAIDQALSNKSAGEFTPPTMEEKEAAPTPEEPVEEPKEEAKEEPAEEVKEEPAEEAKEEPAEDADPIEQLTEDIGDDWTPKAANRFKELKSELKTSRTELEDLRQLTREQTSKLEEMAALVENRDIETLQKQIESYETDKAFTDLESTEAYIQNITEPINELMSTAADIADHYDVESDILVDIISLDKAEDQDAALEHHFPEMSARDKAKVYRIIENVDPILQHRQEMIENVDVALNEAKALEEQKAAADLAEKVQMRQNVTKNVVQRVGEKLPFLNSIGDLDMGAIQEKASELDPTVVHPVDFAYGAVAAELLPKVVREYFTSQKEIETLMAKLSDYEDAEPTMSGAPASDSKPGVVTEDMSFEQAIAAALG